MEEYLNKIAEFYNQKLLLLTNKDKNTKCNSCTNKIEIEETNEKIFLTCGGGKEECRIQFEVDFPEYIYFERDLKKLKDNLEYEINWEVLKKYIDVDDELKEYNERKLYFNKMMDEITKKYKGKKEKLQTSVSAMTIRGERSITAYTPYNENFREIVKGELIEDYIDYMRSKVKDTTKFTKAYSITISIMYDNPNKDKIIKKKTKSKPKRKYTKKK